MIGTLLEKLFVSVGVDLSGFGDELSRATNEVGKSANEMKRSFEGVGKSWQDTGKKMMKAGGVMSAAITAPLLIAGKAAVDGALAQRQAMAQVEATLASMGNAAGRTSEELLKASDALEMKSLFDGDEILQKSTANLLTFGNVAGEQFDRAQQAAVDLATRMGTDLQGATIMVGKALNDPIKGIAALSRVGIQLTDSQKATIEGMAEMGNMAGAQSIILAELERQFGGAAAAAANTDPYRQTQVALGQLGDTVGEAILPIIPQVTEVLTGMIDAFTSLSPEAQTFIIAAAAIAAVLGPVVLAVGALVSGIGLLIPALAATIPIITAIGAAFMTLLLSPLGLIVVAIGAVVAAWYYWDEIVAIVNRVGAAVSAWWNATIKPTLDAVGGAFLAMVDMTIGNLIRLHQGIKTYLQDKLAAVFNWLKSKLEAVGGWFYDLYNSVVGNSYIPDMVDGIGDNMKRLQTLMVDPAKRATAATKDAFRSLATDVSGLLDRLFPLQSQLRKVLEDMALLDAAKAAGQIDGGTYDAARGRLNQERGNIENEINPIEILPASVAELQTGLIDLGAAMEPLPRFASDAEIALRGLGERLGDGIMAGLRDVLSGRRSLKDVARDLLSGFLTDVIGNALKAVESSLFGKGGLGGLLGGLFSSVIKSRAVGGPVVPGRAYTVGAGELMVPSQTGRVLSRNDAMRAAGGGDGRVLRVEVDKSDYFDVKVREVAAPVVQQGIGNYDRVVGDRVDNSFKRRG